MNLTVSFDEQWVKDQFEKGVRVVRALEKWARGEAGVSLVSSRTHELVFSMDPELRPGFSASLEGEIARAFDVGNPAGLVSYSADDGSVTAKAAPAAAAGAGPRDDEEREAAPAMDKAKVAEKTVTVKKDAKPELDPSKTLTELLESVPARDSRAIADFLRETNEVVPMLSRMDALASLWHQHLLLSIDEVTVSAISCVRSPAFTRRTGSFPTESARRRSRSSGSASERAIPSSTTTGTMRSRRRRTWRARTRRTRRGGSCSVSTSAPGRRSSAMPR